MRDKLKRKQTPGGRSRLVPLDDAGVGLGAEDERDNVTARLTEHKVLNG